FFPAEPPRLNPAAHPLTLPTPAGCSSSGQTRRQKNNKSLPPLRNTKTAPVAGCRFVGWEDSAVGNLYPLALAELVALPGPGLAVLLALLRPGITGQVTAFLEQRAVGRVHQEEGPGNGQAGSPGLSVESAAGGSH